MSKKLGGNKLGKEVKTLKIALKKAMKIQAQIEKKHKAEVKKLKAKIKSLTKAKAKKSA